MRVRVRVRVQENELGLKELGDLTFPTLPTLSLCKIIYFESQNSCPEVVLCYVFKTSALRTRATCCVRAPMYDGGLYSWSESLRRCKFVLC